jgi:hypothetical protein
MLNVSLRAFVLLTLITVASPLAHAGSDQQRAERKIEEGAAALLDGMRMLLKSIPWYGQPQMKPNGDIIIPRREAPTLPGPTKKAPQAGDGDSDGETKRL